LNRCRNERYFPLLFARYRRMSGIRIIGINKSKVDDDILDAAKELVVIGMTRRSC